MWLESQEKDRELSPACAGVIPDCINREFKIHAFPHMRGGDPGSIAAVRLRSDLSPHVRVDPAIKAFVLHYGRFSPRARWRKEIDRYTRRSTFPCTRWG